MKKSLFIALSLAYVLPMTAQSLPVSTDMFFRHMELKEVTVTGAVGDMRMKETPMPIVVLQAKELHQLSSTNLIDAIAKQPGVSQITTGSGISKPVIRGLGYNRIVVVNDGIRQEGQQWGDEHGIEIDANEVGAVEILKGPASLMYGSDAMGGVLVFKNMPTLPEGSIKGKVNAEYQTNNGLLGASFNLAGNQKGFTWDARFSEKHAHAYRNRFDGYVPNSQFSERAFSLKAGLLRNWGFTNLKFGYYNLTPSIVEGERDEETGELVRSEEFGVKTYHKTLPFQQVKHYKAVWDNSLNLPKGYLKATVGYQQNRRQEFEERADEYEVFFKLHTVTYDVRYLTQEFDGWKVAAGVNGMWQKSQNLGEEALIPEYRLFDMGGYATVSKAWENWTLNGGVRYDHRHLKYDRTKDFDGVTGSVGAVWNANEHWNVRMNVARGFRAPNMSELGADGVHEGTVRYELGNAHLKSEYSWQADLGVDFTSKYVEAQVALFANRIGNYIFTKRVDVVMEEGYKTYEYTQGDARLLGFEAGADVHPIHRLHFGNTFSFVDARQLHQPEETRYLPFTPAPRWTSEVKYELTHHGKVLNNAYVALGLECFLRQNHYYRADQTETATPSYTLLNLSAGTDVMMDRRKVAEVYVTAENLFNRAYQSHLSRLKYTDINEATGRMGVYNMGRNVVMKVVVPLVFETKK